jgi:putative pyruvate formate lyase activating enzyme
MKTFEPAYIQTARSGLLRKKIASARAILAACVLCPRKCRTDRIANKTGICKTGDRAVVASIHAHFGEEAPLVGSKGSGTIFMTHCNLMCNFCQNYDISHQGYGREISDNELASLMLSLQSQGCHNINIVTPTHVVPQILSALEIAIENGLTIPIIYNSGGYDDVNTLKLLDGVVDIYMPDFKFWDSDFADATCHAPDYPEVARKAVLEMHRQVGDLTMDETGIAQRGLLIRHLVLPENLAGTRDIMGFIHDTVSPNTYVNIMAQYRPCGNAHKTPALARAITAEEYRQALQMAKEEGITRLDRI